MVSETHLKIKVFFCLEKEKLYAERLSWLTNQWYCDTMLVKAP